MSLPVVPCSGRHPVPVGVGSRKRATGNGECWGHSTQLGGFSPVTMTGGERPALVALGHGTEVAGERGPEGPRPVVSAAGPILWRGSGSIPLGSQPNAALVRLPLGLPQVDRPRHEGACGAHTSSGAALWPRQQPRDLPLVALPDMFVPPSVVLLVQVQCCGHFGWAGRECARGSHPGVMRLRGQGERAPGLALGLPPLGVARGQHQLRARGRHGRRSP